MRYDNIYLYRTYIMKLCIGIARGWVEQKDEIKSWVDVLQSQALTERVFEFDVPDYKLLNGNEVRFCQQLSENIDMAAQVYETLMAVATCSSLYHS